MTTRSVFTVLYVRTDGQPSIGLDALAAAGLTILMTDAASVAGLVADASPPELVLIDFGEGAPELIGELVRSRQPNSSWVPVIACCTDRGDIQLAIEAGADDFLVASDAGTIKSRLTVLLRQKSRNDKLDGILNCTFDGIVTIDEGGAILTFNKAASEMFGLQAGEAIGRNVSMLMPEPERSQHDGYVKRYLASGDGKIIGVGRKLTGMRKNGETFPLFLQVTNVRRGRESMFVGILKDLSLEAQAHSLRHEVMHDPLTGIANRRRIVAVLHEWIARSPDASPRPFAVVFLDLDSFKAINDTHGHEAGDAVLKAVGGRLGHGVSRHDIAGRLAGDEFVVLLDDIACRSDAQSVAQRLLAKVSEPVRYGLNEVAVTASAGVAVYPADAATPGELLRCADTAMYRVKNARGGTARLTDLASQPNPGSLWT